MVMEGDRGGGGAAAVTQPRPALTNRPSACCRISIHVMKSSDDYINAFTLDGSCLYLIKGAMCMYEFTLQTNRGLHICRVTTNCC